MKMIKSASKKRTKIIRQHKAATNPSILVLSETRQKAINAMRWYRVSQVTLAAVIAAFIAYIITM